MIQNETFDEATQETEKWLRRKKCKDTRNRIRAVLPENNLSDLYPKTYPIRRRSRRVRGIIYPKIVFRIHVSDLKEEQIEKMKEEDFYNRFGFKEDR